MLKTLSHSYRFAHPIRDNAPVAFRIIGQKRGKFSADFISCQLRHAELRTVQAAHGSDLTVERRVERSCPLSGDQRLRVYVHGRHLYV